MDSYQKLGAKGVNLTKQKYFAGDNTVLACQNAELVLDKAKGGKATLRKRGGMVSTGAAFGGGLFGMFEIKFIEDIVPDAVATETLRPDSDLIALGWDQPTIWDQIDEAVASDVDYGSTSAEPNGVIVGMTNPATPFTGVATAGTLRIRLKHDGVFDPGGFWAIRIYTNSGATQLAEYILDASLSPSSFTLFELDILADMAYDGVTAWDWDDTQVYISPNFATGNSAGTIAYVSFVELELTQ